MLDFSVFWLISLYFSFYIEKKNKNMNATMKFMFMIVLLLMRHVSSSVGQN